MYRCNHCIITDAIICNMQDDLYQIYPMLLFSWVVFQYDVLLVVLQMNNKELDIILASVINN